MRKPHNSDLEFESPRIIEQAQGEALRETVKYAAKHSPFYRRTFEALGVKHSDIKSAADIVKLPFTSKNDLQEHNRELFSVPDAEIAEIVSTTGTTGAPVYIALTVSDLDRLALNEARSFYCAGAAPEDRFHIAVTLDSLFMAGIAYYTGIVKLGCAAIRVGMHNVKRQVELIRDLRPSGIVTVPTFLAKLAEALNNEPDVARNLTLKKALLVGDSIRDRDFRLNRLGNLLSTLCDIELFSTYGNSESAISFCECPQHLGGHEHPDLIISEIIGEDDHRLPDGEVGELVLTTLGVTGMPLVRYRTGDMAFKAAGKCPCGRNSARLGPVLGRKAQMLKFKGTKVYPGAIENAVLDVKGVTNYIIQAFTGDDFSDRIVLKVGCRRKSRKLAEEIRRGVEAAARVKPEIEMLPAGEVDDLRTEGGTRRKPRMFMDLRDRNTAGEDN
ncbi:MAG: AMP-binding protein [Kiritimatiellia bacterium]